MRRSEGRTAGPEAGLADSSVAWRKVLMACALSASSRAWSRSAAAARACHTVPPSPTRTAASRPVAQATPLRWRRAKRRAR